MFSNAPGRCEGTESSHSYWRNRANCYEYASMVFAFVNVLSEVAELSNTNGLFMAKCHQDAPAIWLWIEIFGCWSRCMLDDHFPCGLCLSSQDLAAVVRGMSISGVALGEERNDVLYKAVVSNIIPLEFV